MIKQIRAAYFPNFKNAEYCALSDDPIPDYVNDGDKVYIIDSGKYCIYDATSGTLAEEPNIGLLSGGLQNQVLVKTDDENYNFEWKTITGSSVVEFALDNNNILDIVTL